MAELPEDPVEIDDLFPDDEEPPSPDDQLDASTDAIENIDADEDIEIVDAEPIPLGRSWAFDFVAQRFVQQGNQPATLRGDATLTAWVEKCLRTAQDSAVACPPDFGLPRPVADYLGGPPDEIVQLETDLSEALTTHPNIEAIENIVITEGDAMDGMGSGVEISFTIVQPDGNNIDYSEQLEGELG